MRFFGHLSSCDAAHVQNGYQVKMVKMPLLIAIFDGLDGMLGISEKPGETTCNSTLSTCKHPFACCIGINCKTSPIQTVNIKTQVTLVILQVVLSRLYVKIRRK